MHALSTIRDSDAMCWMYSLVSVQSCMRFAYVSYLVLQCVEGICQYNLLEFRIAACYFVMCMTDFKPRHDSGFLV
jgi:hypothetical protein